MRGKKTSRLFSFTLAIGALIVGFFVGKYSDEINKTFHPKYAYDREIKASNKQLLASGQFQQLESTHFLKNDDSNYCANSPLKNYKSSLFSLQYPDEYSVITKYDLRDTSKDAAIVILWKRTFEENGQNISTFEYQVSVNAYVRKSAPSLIEELKQDHNLSIEDNFDLRKLIKRTSLDGMEALLVTTPGQVDNLTLIAAADNTLYKIYERGPRHEDGECAFKTIINSFRRN